MSDEENQYVLFDHCAMNQSPDNDDHKLQAGPVVYIPVESNRQ